MRGASDRVCRQCDASVLVGACVIERGRWDHVGAGVVAWSSSPLAEGVVMGTFAFARPAKPLHEFLLHLNGKWQQGPLGRQCWFDA
jgi:hypothetical protein